MPPTAPNARTGLLTPPTSTRRARSKTFCERLCSFSGRLPTHISPGFKDQTIKRGLAVLSAGLGPSRHVLGMIGEHNLGAGPLNRSQHFQRDALFVQPAITRGGLDHGVFAA